MRSLLKASLIWGVIGVATSALLYAINYVTDTQRFFSTQLGSYANHAMVDFWPASIMLLGLEYTHSTATVIEVFVTALALNFLLYSLVGVLLTLIWRAAKKVIANSGSPDAGA